MSGQTDERRRRSRLEALPRPLFFLPSPYFAFSSWRLGATCRYAPRRRCGHRSGTRPSRRTVVGGAQYARSRQKLEAGPPIFRGPAEGTMRVLLACGRMGPHRGAGVRFAARTNAKGPSPSSRKRVSCTARAVPNPALGSPAIAFARDPPFPVCPEPLPHDAYLSSPQGPSPPHRLALAIIMRRTLKQRMSSGQGRTARGDGRSQAPRVRSGRLMLMFMANIQDTIPVTPLAPLT
ncbi:hypothetical protein GY45DRAFT_728383 [Cubamyces sp. BRFM 1775]|nr:hypothetical protein GY45DRAFT_728383 [Cubamyces sp. BRFM 1775]